MIAHFLTLITVITVTTLCMLPSAPLATAQPVPARELSIAYQPLASPAGVIFETFRRDRLLRQALARQGLTLRLVPVADGGEAIKAFKQGDIAMTTLGDMPALELAAAMPVTYCAQLKQNYAMVVGPKGLVPKDLKGKKIGNVFASSGHFALLRVLNSAGLSEKEVRLVQMPVNQMPDALYKGSIDAFAAWEPTPSLVISSAPDRFAAIGRQNSSAYLVANRSFTSQHPEAIRLVAAGLVRAMTWLKNGDNLHRAAEWNQATINSFSSITRNHVEEISRISSSDLTAIRYSPRIAPLMRVNGKLALAEELEFLKAVGKIAKEAQWDTIQQSFNRDIVEQVLRNPAKYELKRYHYE